MMTMMMTTMPDDRVAPAALVIGTETAIAIVTVEATAATAIVVVVEIAATLVTKTATESVTVVATAIAATVMIPTVIAREHQRVHAADPVVARTTMIRHPRVPSAGQPTGM